jgi:hypothetical protein
MPAPKNQSYRSLELLCRKQAALTATPETRKALEAMAHEYKLLTDCLQHQLPERASDTE